MKILEILKVKLFFKRTVLKLYIYDILCINRKNKELIKDIKDEIHKREIIAKNTDKLGSISISKEWGAYILLYSVITANVCVNIIWLTKLKITERLNNFLQES